MLRQLTPLARGLVMILVKTEGTAQFCGTGFICHNGYVFTCAHILNLTAEITIAPTQPIDRFEQRTLTQVSTLPAMVAQYDSVNDVALLKVTPTQSIIAPNNQFAPGESIAVGTSVGCLGVPFGGRGMHTPKLTSSIICGKSISETGTKTLHLDANIHEGNSGGPIIDVTSKKIIGIVTGRFSPTGREASIRIGDFGLGQDSTISYGVPIEYAQALLQEELRNG
jgi:S1-C subfamily serine protease